MLVLLAVATWIYFKVLLPKNDTHTQHEGMTGMENMKMDDKDENMNTSAAKEKVPYTCSMHPEIIRDKPGNCPICGMQLVKKESESKEIHDVSLHTLLQPTNGYAISAIPATTLKKVKNL